MVTCKGCGKSYSLAEQRAHNECGGPLEMNTRELADMDSSYHVEVRCSNCDFSGRLRVAKGTPVTQRACPHCKCATLTKAWQQPTF